MVAVSATLAILPDRTSAGGLAATAVAPASAGLVSPRMAGVCGECRRRGEEYGPRYPRRCAGTHTPIGAERTTIGRCRRRAGPGAGKRGCVMLEWMKKRRALPA